MASRPNWRRGAVPRASADAPSVGGGAASAVAARSASTGGVSPAVARTASSSSAAGDRAARGGAGAPTSTDMVRTPSATSLASEGPASDALNPENSTAIVFYEAANEFASACAEVWPSDAVIVAEAARLAAVGSALEAKQAEGARLAALFHDAFADNYGLIQRKDAAFFDLPDAGLVAVHAAAKYASAAPPLRDTLWEYLRSLMQYAGMVDMYSKCPRGMLNSISNLAHGLLGKMQTGEVDPSKLNPLELGQMMMQSMSTEDLESFGTAIMSGGNLDTMMTIMQSTMGGALGGGGGAGGDGGLDLGSLMGMLGGGGK